MTSIAKTARVALAVAVLALTTAGAASADAFHPDPFQSESVPADAFHPDPFLQRGVAPGDAFRPDPFLSRGRAARVSPNIGGCTRGCVI